MFHSPMITIVVLGILFSLPGGPVARGQVLAPETDPVLDTLDDEIKSFLEAVSLGQVQSAYDELLLGSHLAKQDKALKKLVEQTQELQSKYGEYRAFEQIAARRIGNDLVLLKYLYKCEHFPVVWYFTFYRTPGETPPENSNWRVVIVRFDTELELLGYGGGK